MRKCLVCVPGLHLMSEKQQEIFKVNRTEYLQFNNVELKVIKYRLKNYKIKFLKIFGTLSILHNNP